MLLTADDADCTDFEVRRIFSHSPRDSIRRENFDWGKSFVFSKLWFEVLLL